MINVYYEKSMKLWVAYLSDDIGQLGNAEYDPDRDKAVFFLGLERGIHPEKFTRPVSSFFEQLEEVRV